MTPLNGHHSQSAARPSPAAQDESSEEESEDESHEASGIQVSVCVCVCLVSVCGGVWSVEDVSIAVPYAVRTRVAMADPGIDVIRWAC